MHARCGRAHACANTHTHTQTTAIEFPCLSFHLIKYRWPVLLKTPQLVSALQHTIAEFTSTDISFPLILKKL